MIPELPVISQRRKMTKKDKFDACVAGIPRFSPKSNDPALSLTKCGDLSPRFTLEP
jgi:hypothetical protein